MENSAGAEPPADERYIALAVRSRRRLVDELRSAGRPMDIGELAAVVGLHVTTTRLHLHVLERAGLISRTSRPPAGPGRPRQLYTHVPQVAAEGHRQLAELLAAALDTDGEDGRRLAEAAGHRWADQQLGPRHRLSWDDAVEDVEQLFRRLGFAPRAVDVDGGGRRLALESCPFRDVARAHPQVVCSMHLGLLRGALATAGMAQPAGAADLHPFVAPELCIADIPGPAAERPGGELPTDAR